MPTDSSGLSPSEKELYEKTKTSAQTMYKQNIQDEIAVSQGYVKIGEEYKKINPEWPFKLLYIDTIDYCEWIEQLEKLQTYKRKLEAMLAVVGKKQTTASVIPAEETKKDTTPTCNKNFPLSFGKWDGLVNSVTNLINDPLYAIFGDIEVLIPVLDKNYKERPEEISALIDR